MGGDPAFVRLDIAAGFEAQWIELEGLVRLLERHETTRVPDDVGVGDAAVFARHRGVGRARVETAKQRLARGMFQLPFRRSNVAVAISDLSALDEEGVDHAVAGKPVVMTARLELRVRPVTVEGAPEARRNLARDLEVVVVLASHRREIPAEIGIGRWRFVHRPRLPRALAKAWLLRRPFGAECASEIDSSTARTGRKRVF